MAPFSSEAGHKLQLLSALRLAHVLLKHLIFLANKRSSAAPRPPALKPHSSPPYHEQISLTKATHRLWLLFPFFLLKQISMQTQMTSKIHFYHVEAESLARLWLYFSSCQLPAPVLFAQQPADL